MKPALVDIPQIGLVRVDWVGLYKPQLGLPSFPGTNPNTGALALYDNGTITWTPREERGLFYKAWHASLENISDVRPVTIWWPYTPSTRTLRAKFKTQDWTVTFTGSKPNVKLSLIENVAMHLPAHHTFGLGQIYAATRLEWKQRGSKARAEESCAAWLDLLRGTLDAKAFGTRFAESALWKEYALGI